MNYLKGLNKAQKKVAVCGLGPRLVLAGAGTGKTTTIVARVLHLIKERNVDPYNILLVTFTNKAAGELKQRLRKYLSALECSRLVTGTFHSVGMRILYKHYRKLSLPSSFSVVPPEDCISVIRKLHPKNLSAKDGKRVFDLLKRREVFFEKFEKLVPEKEVKLMKRIHEDFKAYKIANGLVDFEDMLSLPTRLLKDNKKVSKLISSRFEYVLVDEYQDTCKLQVKMLKQLTKEHKNIMAVGDSHQSIYGFRGANYNNIFNFEDDFKGAKVHLLEDNYRSKQPILDLANSFAETMDTKYKKVLKTTDTKPARQPKLLLYRDANSHYEDVAGRIGRMIDKGTPPGEIAVLYRSNFLGSQMEVQLRLRNVSYKRYGGLSFFSRTYVKGLLAFASAFSNPKNELPWLRILSFVDGIGPKTAAKLFQSFRATKLLSESAFVKTDVQRESLRSIELGFSNFKSKATVREQFHACLDVYRPILQAVDDTSFAQKAGILSNTIDSISPSFKTVSSFLTSLNLGSSEFEEEIGVTNLTGASFKGALLDGARFDTGQSEELN